MIVIAIGAASALIAPLADARSVCGAEPAVGVVYRVAAVHLNLQVTGHFQDASGDYQDATFTMDGISHPRFSYKNFGDFGGCPGDPPSCIVGASICRGDWWSSTVTTMTTQVTESGFDSGAQSGNPPASSSCAGSYRGAPTIMSAWRTTLFAGQGAAGTPRKPRLAVGAYVQPLQFGTCVISNVEVLSDIVSGVLNNTYYARTRLAMGVLWHTRRRFTMPVNVSYSGGIPVTGDQYYADPGARTTVNLRWQGSISFARAYTCTPNGCRPPTQLPPAADRER